MTSANGSANFLRHIGAPTVAALAIVVAATLTAGVHDAVAQDAWQYRLTPYGWLAGLKGDVGTIPGQPPAAVDVSPSDALKDLRAGGMLMLDAKRQRHGYLLDLMYTDVRSEEQLLPPPIDLALKSISKTTIASLAYQYELLRQDQTVVDLFAGLRYWKIDTDLRFGGGLGILAGRGLRTKESWVDPGIGIKAHAPIGGTPFYMEGGVAIGGFGVGSDRFYEINANVGYQWTKTFGTTVGYRMFDVDYNNDGFVYDVRQQGWQFGLTWSF